MPPITTTTAFIQQKISESIEDEEISTTTTLSTSTNGRLFVFTTIKSVR